MTFKFWSLNPNGIIVLKEISSRLNDAVDKFKSKYDPACAEITDIMNICDGLASYVQYTDPEAMRSRIGMANRSLSELHSKVQHGDNHPMQVLISLEIAMSMLATEIDKVDMLHYNWKAVPVDPQDDQLTAMALRSDLNLGIAGYYDSNDSAACKDQGDSTTHQQKMENTKRLMASLYAEAIGEGMARINSLNI